MGLTVDLERVAEAARALADQLVATPRHKGDEVTGAAVVPFVLGVEAMRDALLELVDVEAVGAPGVDLERAALEFCRSRCPYTKRATPGLSKHCDGCPLQAVSAALYAAAADAGKVDQ